MSIVIDTERRLKDVRAIEQGDTVEAQLFDEHDERWVARGPARVNFDGALFVGSVLIRNANREPSRHLITILNHVPKPQPYAEGTDRTEPMFGDVVTDAELAEDALGVRMIYCPRDIPGHDPTPWRAVSDNEDVLYEPYSNGKRRFTREDLPDRLRLQGSMSWRGIGGDS